MKHNFGKYFSVIALVGTLMFTSCHFSKSGDGVSKVKGEMIEMNSEWDANSDKEAMDILQPYKDSIHNKMDEVIGKSAMKMEKGKPEGLLSNLVAEVIRQSAKKVIDGPADMGLVNMGGLRNILPEGDITVSTIYEILPFENSLCVMTMKGSDMRSLFKSIASLGGEGVSGIRLEITKDGALEKATIDGKEIDDNRTYTVATIDYLADGNGRMDAFLNATNRVCPDGATLRSIFLEYVKQQTASGKQITSELDGRITVK